MLKALKKLFSGKPKKKAPAKKNAAGKRAKSQPKKKPASKKPKRVAKKPAPKAPAPTKPIGTVTHFYGGIKVAIVRFKQDMRQGTEVRFKGATTDFVQPLDSMQYDHKPVAKAPKGKQVGIKVKKRVRKGDRVYMGSK